MDGGLQSAFAEAVEVFESVCDVSTAPPSCMLRRVRWADGGDGNLIMRCEAEVPDPASIAALHGADANRIAREAGIRDAEDLGDYLARMHAVSVKSTLIDWYGSVCEKAEAVMSNRPHSMDDGTIFKLSPRNFIQHPAIDETDGDTRLLVFEVPIRIDELPQDIYDKAEAACDENFPGWRAVSSVEFEPGLDEKGAYLDGSFAFDGRSWNVWVTKFPDGMDAGFVIGGKASSMTFAKRQGFKSFPQCVTWIESVIDGIKAGAYDKRIRSVEGGAR